MLALATSDQPDVLCAQEVPAWALRRFTVGDLAKRPPLGMRFGRLLTAPHHGLMRGAVAGQGLGIWLGPHSKLLSRHVVTVNPRHFRAREARAMGLDREARWTWAKERRVLQVVRLSVAGQRFVVANIHCTGHRDKRIPDAELLVSAQHASSLAEPGDVVVLAGDFNLRPAQSQTLALLTGLEWGFSAAGPRIDHILVRGAAAGPLQVWPQQSRRTNGTLLSDHAPIEIEISGSDEGP